MKTSKMNCTLALPSLLSWVTLITEKRRYLITSGVQMWWLVKLEALHNI